jgi:hypothetical protein
MINCHTLKLAENDDILTSQNLYSNAQTTFSRFAVLCFGTIDSLSEYEKEFLENTD